MNDYKELSNQLVDKIIKELVNKEAEDISFMVAPLYQTLEDNEKLLNDISKYKYYVTYFEPEEEDEYTNGYISIYLSDKDGNELPYIYELEFNIDRRLWGYCQCSDEDKDYDARYGCCGHGCDWYAPAYSIRKITYIYNNSWIGDEHDYWDFKDNFYNVTKKEKESEIRQSKINYLKDNIKFYKKELDKILNESEG